MTGIRTKLAFERPSGCPIAEASAEMDGPLTDVTWTEPADGAVAEQFTAADAPAEETFDPVFDYGRKQVYEFDRDAGQPCICEHIQQTLAPVTSVHARDGTLYVTVHATDIEQLRELLSELREEFGDVSMEYLVQSRVDASDSELVPVDLKRLTDRQREVLETAFEMGYFEYPRGANASEVAEELGIEPSTLAEHMAAAQSKLLEEVLGGER